MASCPGWDEDKEAMMTSASLTSPSRSPQEPVAVQGTKVHLVTAGAQCAGGPEEHGDLEYGHAPISDVMKSAMASTRQVQRGARI